MLILHISSFQIWKSIFGNTSSDIDIVYNCKLIPKIYSFPFYVNLVYFPLTCHFFTMSLFSLYKRWEIKSVLGNQKYGKLLLFISEVNVYILGYQRRLETLFLIHYFGFKLYLFYFGFTFKWIVCDLRTHSTLQVKFSYQNPGTKDFFGFIALIIIYQVVWLSGLRLITRYWALNKWQNNIKVKRYGKLTQHFLEPQWH